MSDLELTMMRRVGELKAEVERLDTLCKQLMAQHSDISCDNIMLRKANDQLAEVRELHAGFNRALFNETVTENARLKAEVERLTKAGDNMYSWLGVCGRHNNSTGDDWLRAKKGLPSLTEQWEIEKRNRAAEDAAKEGKGQP